MPKKKKFRKKRRPAIGFYRKGGKVRPITAPRGFHKGHPVETRRIVKPKGFTINLKYSKKKGDGESLVVVARDYIHALGEAFEEKTDRRQPVEISVIDPSLGEIVRLIGRGAKRAAEIGTKYAIKGGHVAKQAAIKASPHVKKGIREAWKGTMAVGKYGKATMIRKAQTSKLKKLIREAYSEDRPVRTIARLELKTKYPDVYDICDFSRT